MRLAGRICLMLWTCMAALPLQAAFTTRTYAELATYPAFEVPAAVESLETGRLGAELNGKIARVAVQPGQQVAKGQELFRLDCRDLELAEKRLQASLRAAEARRRLSRNQAERAVTLMHENFISREYLNQRQAEFEAASAEYQSLTADRDRLRHDIGKCVIRAPYPGIVKERYASLGEFVAPGTPLLHLVGTGRVEVVARLPGKLLESLQRGRAFSFEAGGERHELRPRAIGGVFDPRERAAEVRLTFVARPAEPGRAGVLRWQESARHLPAELLVTRDGRLGLFIVQDNRARFYAIPGAQSGRPVAVDLPPDIRVVVEGRHALRDGDPVR